MSLLAAALFYAELGYKVFPCAPGEKRPLTQHGLRDASQDSEQIETWWARWPSANVAIATDGLVVVDVDGADNAWLRDNPDQQLDLSAAPQSLTANGGRQYIFHQPPGKDWRNTTGRIAARVDTRGNGGYIVVPPSVLTGDKHYHWQPTSELEVAPHELPEPPAWLTTILDGIANDTASGLSPRADGNIIPEGQRNGTLARLAGGMRRNGMSCDEICAALLVTNQSRCKPPLPASEVERIASSIARYQPDAVSVALVEDHYTQIFTSDRDRQDAAPNCTDPGPIPEHLFRVPGFVSQVMDFTLANAPYPNVGLAFCGALALLSYLCGRKVCDPGDLRPNIYLLALASSGTGKDFPRKVNARVLFEIGHVAALGDKFASGEGIQDALARTSAMLFQNDEMDGVLRQINLDRENKRESIPNILLTLYTSANDVYPLRVKAAQKEAGHIDQPHLTLFGTATPQYFYESLSQRMLTNGFFARLIIVDIGKRGEGQSPGSPRNVPETILQTARWWAEFQPGTRRANLLDVHPEPRVVPWTPDANEAFAALRRETELEYDAAHERNDEVARVAWSRTHENAKKLALLRACSENHEDPRISLPGVEWATAFAMHQTRRQLYLASMYVAENPFHAECLKLVRKLREAPCRELSHSVLLKRMKMKSKDFRDLVETLVQRGDITPVQATTQGRTGLSYRVMEGGETW